MTTSTTRAPSLADDVWLTTAEAAAYSRCSIVTIHRHAAAHTLRSTGGGSGRPRKYRREWLDAWLEKAPRLPKPRLAEAG